MVDGGGIGEETTDEEITKYFAQFGNVLEVEHLYSRFIYIEYVRSSFRNNFIIFLGRCCSCTIRRVGKRKGVDLSCLR